MIRSGSTMSEFSFDISSLRAAYLSGSLTPVQMVAEVLRRIATLDDRGLRTIGFLSMLGGLLALQLVYWFA